MSFSRPFYAVMSGLKPLAGVRPMLVNQQTSFAIATADMAFAQMVTMLRSRGVSPGVSIVRQGGLARTAQGLGPPSCCR